MSIPQQIQQAVQAVSDQQSFINVLLRQALGWEIPEGIGDVEQIAYQWPIEELRAEGLDEKIVDGQVWQIQPLNTEAGQQWGIFVLEFKSDQAFVTGRGLTGPLRKVLRGLVPNRRNRQANLPAWDRPNLLFICTYEYKHFRFAYFKAPKSKEKTAPLALFGWNQGNRDVRTLCEHNLPYLQWDSEASDFGHWREAFSIEKVTKDFYREYAKVFETVETIIGEVNPISGNDLRLYTQMLFNRLMFLRFIEKKGWLRFKDSTDYLATLYITGGDSGQSFYQSRLCPLFFEALAVEGMQELNAVGKVPFLNGGLFEKIEGLDDKVNDIPDTAFENILGQDGLFYRFNFTVEESTPLDIEVAVDPEMLGKVFEELVTGRHESGSYYTPRPIVSFMCKEALKGFLCGKTSASKKAIEKIVDDHEVAQGLTDLHAEEILYYLDTIKACDPACGSGAYLLGLLQELIAIRRTLQNERLLTDAAFMYKLKLGIISRSLYGVDIDEFATNVAKLRLWLSLAVEAEKPQPLPNLDFKIETGDSVLGPCTPYLETEEALTMSALRERAKQLVLKKERFMLAHGKEKRGLFDEIRQEEAAIAKETATVYGNNVIAWHIHFAEVFVSGRRQQQIDRNIADIGDFKVTTIEPGGFDIVLTNPPYVRHELIKDIKQRLKKVYPKTYTGMADLYTYFYTRAVETLAPGGILVFISSNKWFRANYGKKIRKYLASNCGILSITDFLDSPIFENTTAYPMIFIAQKAGTIYKTIYTEMRVPNGNIDVKGSVREHGKILGDNAIKGENWSFVDRKNAAKIEKMKATGLPLEEYINKKICVGIKTGLNEAFVINSQTRKRLIEENPASEDLIRPFLMGKDIKRWSISEDNLWVILAKDNGNTSDYPAVMEHLKGYEDKLKNRSDQGHNWWELRPCTYYDEFDKPKIVFPDISPEPRFTLDMNNYCPDMTAFVIPSSSLFLLGVLNSKCVLDFYLEISAQIRGGYLRYKRQYVTQIPIPQAQTKEIEIIEKLVQKCLDAEGQDCEKWEKEIDEIVTKLYGL